MQELRIFPLIYTQKLRIVLLWSGGRTGLPHRHTQEKEMGKHFYLLVEIKILGYRIKILVNR